LIGEIMKIIEKTFDVNTNEETISERNATNDEIAQAEWLLERVRVSEEQKAEAEAKKAAALAKLAALGLTEDDLKAII